MSQGQRETNALKYHTKISFSFHVCEYWKKSLKEIYLVSLLVRYQTFHNSSLFKGYVFSPKKYLNPCDSWVSLQTHYI